LDLVEWVLVGLTKNLVNRQFGLLLQACSPALAWLTRTGSPPGAGFASRGGDIILGMDHLIALSQFRLNKFVVFRAHRTPSEEQDELLNNKTDIRLTTYDLGH
jgi:hypothetical protein